MPITAARGAGAGIEVLWDVQPAGGAGRGDALWRDPHPSPAVSGGAVPSGCLSQHEVAPGPSWGLLAQWFLLSAHCFSEPFGTSGGKAGSGSRAVTEISKASGQRRIQRKRVSSGVSLLEHHRAHGTGHSTVPCCPPSHQGKLQTPRWVSMCTRRQLQPKQRCSSPENSLAGGRRSDSEHGQHGSLPWWWLRHRGGTWPWRCHRSLAAEALSLGFCRSPPWRAVNLASG